MDMLDVLLNPEFPQVRIDCAPFGVPMTLVLVLPRETPSLFAALWVWPSGRLGCAEVGRA